MKYDTASSYRQLMAVMKYASDKCWLKYPKMTNERNEVLVDISLYDSEG